MSRYEIAVINGKLASVEMIKLCLKIFRAVVVA